MNICIRPSVLEYPLMRVDVHVVKGVQTVIRMIVRCIVACVVILILIAMVYLLEPSQLHSDCIQCIVYGNHSMNDYINKTNTSLHSL